MAKRKHLRKWEWWPNGPHFHFEAQQSLTSGKNNVWILQFLFLPPLLQDTFHSEPELFQWLARRWTLCGATFASGGCSGDPRCFKYVGNYRCLMTSFSSSSFGGNLVCYHMFPYLKESGDQTKSKKKVAIIKPFKLLWLPSGTATTRRRWLSSRTSSASRTSSTNRLARYLGLHGEEMKI